MERFVAEPGEPIWARFLAAREHADLSQEELSAKLSDLLRRHVDQSAYSRWERGVNQPDEVTQRAVAHATGVAAGWITHGELGGCIVPPWFAAWRRQFERSERLAQWRTLTAKAPKRRA